MMVSRLRGHYLEELGRVLLPVFLGAGPGMMGQLRGAVGSAPLTLSCLLLYLPDFNPALPVKEGSYSGLGENFSAA